MMRSRFVDAAAGALALVILASCQSRPFDGARGGDYGAVAVKVVWPASSGATGLTSVLANFVPESAPSNVGYMRVTISGPGMSDVTPSDFSATAATGGCTPAPCAVVGNIPAGTGRQITLTGLGLDDSTVLFTGGPSAAFSVVANATVSSPGIAMVPTVSNTGSVPWTPSGFTVTGGLNQWQVGWWAIQSGSNPPTYNGYISASATPAIDPKNSSTYTCAQVCGSQTDLLHATYGGGTSLVKPSAGTDGTATITTANAYTDAGPNTNSNVVNGQPLYLVLNAQNGVGLSPPTQELTATPFGPPGIPQNVQAIAGNNSVALSWNAIGNAASYNVYRSGSTINGHLLSPRQFAQTITTGVTGTSYNDTSAVNGNAYHYVVTAVGGTTNVTGESPAAKDVGPVTPQAPVAGQPTITAVQGGTSQVTISWTAPSAGTVTTYGVGWATTPGAEVVGAPCSGLANTILTCTVTGLTNFTTYYFVVVPTGTSVVNSAEVSSTPLAAASGLTAASGDGKAVLTWTSANVNFNLFNVYRATAPSSCPAFSGMTRIATGVNAVNYTDLTPINGTQYCYMVTTAQGNSESSPTAGTLVTAHTQFSQLAAGAGHVLGIKADGSLWAWGLNANGQLGLNDTTNRSTPTKVGSKTWSSVAAGDDFSVGIDSANTLWTWGNNSAGQLGFTLSTAQLTVPTQLNSNPAWQRVTAGGQHAAATWYYSTTNANNLYAWGANTYGAVGNCPAATTCTSPVIGITLIGSTSDNWVGMAAGSYHTIGVKSGGTLWAWGDNANSQMGVATGTTCNGAAGSCSPVQVTSPAVSWSYNVAAGTFHSLAISATNYAYAWGYNGNGQLGNSSGCVVGSNVAVPTQCFSVSTNWLIAYGGMAAGYYHSAAIWYSGSAFTLWSLGDNASGQVGNNSTVQQNSEVQITPPNAWNTGAAGAFFTVWRASDSTVWAWGSNKWGQLGGASAPSTCTDEWVGSGTTSCALVPKQIP